MNARIIRSTKKHVPQKCAMKSNLKYANRESLNYCKYLSLTSKSSLLCVETCYFLLYVEMFTYK